jgi:excisionase family DNA binding protein
VPITYSEFRSLVNESRRQYSRALCNGVLLRAGSCQECGAEGKIDGHHDDYSQPLEVRWLCHTCHRKADKETRARYRQIVDRGTPKKLTSLGDLDTLDRFVNPEEVAQLVGCHRLTIYRNVKAGRLKCLYVGASIRFEPKAVAEWLRAR